MNNSLMSIIDELKYFCEQHYSKPRFEFEAVENIQTFATEDKDYPVVFASYVSVEKQGEMMVYRIRIHVLNRINRDRGNTLDNYNDTSFILNDIMKLWDEDSESDIFLINEPSSDVYNNSQLDYCQGVYADFDLEVPDYGRCEVPADMWNGVPIYDGTTLIYNKFLTCSTLNECSTFTDTIDNIQEQINNIEPFDCDDLNNCQTITDIQNEFNNYLPLTGGIITGQLNVNIQNWTFDFMEALNITIYADDNYSIDEITNIVNVPTITIEVNDLPYTLENPILLGDKIYIESDINSVIKIKIVK